MKLKNMWKRFWTLDVHNHEGFTLVELIIVIAILAILSTGAIAGYSAYVTKANKTADQSMIAEIKTVLSLKAYSDGVSNADYVILTKNGAQAGGAFAEEALADAYGSNWADALKLKSDEWTAGAFLVNIEDANLIAGSTFMTDATPDGLMQAVTNLTGAASTVISTYDGDPAGVLNSLGMQDVADKIANTGLNRDEDRKAYDTAISNLLVGKFADSMSNLTLDNAMQDDLAGTVLLYAAAFAYCESNEDTTTMNEINAHLSSQTGLDGIKTNAFMDYIGTLDFADGFGEYLESEQGTKDMEATLKIMGAVNNVSNQFTSASDLSRPDLYASDVVSQQLNDYVGAIKAVAQMDPALRAELQQLDPNSVAFVITIAEDGTVA